MPELPEIVVISKQMNETIAEKKIESVAIYQSKCLNRPEEDYARHLVGQKVKKVAPLGKWVEIHFSRGDRLLISLGMGGELLYFTSSSEIPSNVKFVVRFTDQSGFYITLSWFGYFHLILKGESNPMTDSLGSDALEISLVDFQKLLKGNKSGIKSFLMNQKNLRGIGNFYIQEILFQARIHPLKKIDCLTDENIVMLYDAMQSVLEEAVDKGSSFYEVDFFGQKGDYTLELLSFAYKEGAKCPVCGAETEKIKTGSTAQYVCPRCQPIA
ncbi:MAG: DNA-formamidopyrimidine glycosylase family protein [Candidatus Zhuqueibacterota bacterium]